MQTLQQNASIITSMNTEQISDVQLDRHYLFWFAKRDIFDNVRYFLDDLDDYHLTVRCTTGIALHVLYKFMTCFTYFTYV